MLLVHDADHLLPLNLQCRTRGNGSGGSQAPPAHAGEGIFSHEVAGREKRDGGLIPILGNHGEFGTAFLQIEDGAGRMAL